MEVLEFVAALPAHWQGFALGALLFLGWANNLATLLSAALKPALGTPDPLRDSVWKGRAFRAVEVLDWIAGTTSKLPDKRLIVDQRRQLHEQMLTTVNQEAVMVSMEQTIKDQAKVISASKRGLPAVKL
jgi:hypothetical protein